MEENQKKGWDKYKISILIISILLLGYSIIRSYLLSLTYDEAWTYMSFVSQPIKNILHTSTNNHIFNTFLIKIFTKIFGVSEFTIRIPALIGQTIYLLGIYLILKLFLKKWFLVLGFLIIAIQPFILDFFSIARGYSLAIGFSSLGIYYLFKRIKESEKKKNTILLIIFFSLATLSILTFMNLLISVITVLLILELNEIFIANKQYQRINIGKIKESIKFSFKYIFPSLIILILIYLNRIKDISITRNLTYGTEKFMETIKSLIKYSFEKNYFNINILKIAEIFLTLILIFAIFVIIYKLLKNKNIQIIDKYLIVILSLLIICYLSSLLQNLIFNIKFPLDRTGIYFILLFYILGLILLGEIKEIKFKTLKKILNGIVIILIISLTIESINEMNFTHTKSWQYDASTKEMINLLKELNKNNNAQISLGINGIFELSTNFYKLKNNLNWLTLEIVKDNNFNYYYLRKEDKKLIEEKKLTLIKEFKVSNSYLYKEN